MNWSAQGVLFTRYSIMKHLSCLLSKPQEKGRMGKSWKLVVYHLRGFSINMKLCKLWGSHERHFLWGPYLFCKEFYLRGSKNRRALIMPSSETILQRRKAQAAACDSELTFFSSTKEGRREENISWAPPRHFHIQRTSFKPHHNPVRCDFTYSADEETEAQGRGKATCPRP